MNRFKLLASAAACAAAFQAAAESSPIMPQLTGGVADASNPTRNAVVYIVTGGAGCTGTLVAPDIVMTSGHCVPTLGTTPRADRTWEPMTPGVSSVVRFGPNPAAPVATATGNRINYSGTDDIVLIGLTSRVPATVAVPRKIHFDAPAGLDGTDFLYNVGYGNGTPVRQVGYSREYRPFRALRDPSLADNYFCFDDEYGELGLGDSGSPVLWGGPEGKVMGVYQGNATCKVAGLEHPSAPFTGENDGAVMTFGKGNPSGPRADIGDWLRHNVLRSFCSRTTSMRSTIDAGRHLKLLNWWSVARVDNFATSQPNWSGCYTDWDFEVDHDGYAYFRNEGWVLNPAFARPAGTVSLYLWWNATTMDNAASTSLVPIVRAGWTRGPLLGYVYSSPVATAELVALRLWYSATRQDYLTTTNTLDYTSSGYVRVGAGVGGGGAGVVGYVKRQTAVR